MCKLDFKSRIAVVLMLQTALVVLMLSWLAADSDWGDYEKILSKIEPANSIGKFELCTEISDGHTSARWNISADNLIIEDGRLGIFRTYSHKTARFKNLSLQIVPSVSNRKNAIACESTTQRQASYSTAPASFSSVLFYLFEDFTSYADGWKLELDAGNLSSVRVEGFSYEISDGSDVLLSVGSRRASLTHKGLPILLEGLVVIATASGTTLRANKVEWDIGNSAFIADEGFLLKEAGSYTSGEKITVKYESSFQSLGFSNCSLGKEDNVQTNVDFDVHGGYGL